MIKFNYRSLFTPVTLVVMSVLFLLVSIGIMVAVANDRPEAADVAAKPTQQQPAHPAPAKPEPTKPVEPVPAKTTQRPTTVELPPCLTETSENCYWNARVRSNKVGMSYVNIDGSIYYLP